jgi:Alternative complex III, ActD subunit
MAIKRFVVGSFDDEAVLFPAVKKVRLAGYKIHDVYTPMPIHGLDTAMGLRDTSLHTAGFIYGITGTTTALTGISYALIYDWPLNFGGKPHFALPAWIPIIFELTVLFASVGMVLTFCYLCQMAPFVRKHHFSLRSTDDLFVMVIECTSKTNVADLEAFMKTAGASDVHVQDAETGWWLGTYSRNIPSVDNAKTILA